MALTHIFVSTTTLSLFSFTDFLDGLEHVFHHFFVAEMFVLLMDFFEHSLKSFPRLSLVHHQLRFKDELMVVKFNLKQIADLEPKLLSDVRGNGYLVFLFDLHEGHLRHLFLQLQT